MAAEVRVPAKTDESGVPVTGPFSADQVVPTLIMLAVAMLGGFVNFWRKYREGRVRAFNLTELVGEMVVSGVCGVLAYWAFRGLGVNEWLTAAGVGVVGHMGSRAVFMAEQWIENKFGAKAPEPRPPTRSDAQGEPQ